MIGNDIVDWVQAKRESNWQRTGFLAKLFTDKEQQLIQEATNPEQMVWTLWSMKESVYKADVRQTGKRVFAPKKIVCELTTLEDNFATGTAFYTDHYHLQASLTPNYVAGVAYLINSSPVFQELIIPLNEVVPPDQSAHLYQQIKQTCASTLSISVDAAYIRKDEVGTPELIITTSLNESVAIPISISHHGRYGAFVIDYSNCPAICC